MTFYEWWDENKPAYSQFWFLEESFRKCWEAAHKSGYEVGHDDGVNKAKEFESPELKRK